MRRLQQGDQAALDVLYHRYSRRMLAYFHRMLAANPDGAQDLLQDLFLKIVDRPHLFHPDQRFVTWFYSVAHNMCKNEYRKRATRRKTMSTIHIENNAEQWIDPGRTPDESCDQRQFHEAMMTELAKMDAGKRSIFLLRHQEDFSIREISRIHNCPEGTVKSSLHYTIRKLAVALQQFHSILMI